MDYSDKEVTIPVGPSSIQGILVIPPNAKALVLFAHGSASNRLSPRNRQVAEYLNESGFATLLLDLLSPDEHARDVVMAQYRFDIPMLAERLIAIMEWAQQQADLRALPLCLFGTSTGSAAALKAAAERPGLVQAIVSRGGRPDFAYGALDCVLPPTLLIVGALDEAVLKLNEQAATRMWGVRELAVVPGASHMFEEPGKMEIVANYTAEWFTSYARMSPPVDPGKTKAKHNPRQYH